MHYLDNEAELAEIVAIRVANKAVGFLDDDSFFSKEHLGEDFFDWLATKMMKERRKKYKKLFRALLGHRDRKELGILDTGEPINTESKTLNERKRA